MQYQMYKLFIHPRKRARMSDKFPPRLFIDTFDGRYSGIVCFIRQDGEQIEYLSLEEYTAEVERLKGENERLRKALEWYAKPALFFHNGEIVEDGFRKECGVFHYTDPPKEIPGIPLGTRAREALKLADARGEM
jgi:hypothetical protein